VDRTFDRRVVPERALILLRALQERVPCHLGGGAALSGVHLRHRLSRDLDLFCHEPEQVRELLRALPDAAQTAGVGANVVRDAGTFVRASLDLGDQLVELDLVHEGTEDLDSPVSAEGVLTESLVDLRVAKLTCILSRSEPRDLVDLLFLDRAGCPPEADLALALRKDRGIDPAILAWLLGQYPTRPLPEMLVPLSEDELRRFRDELRDRLKRSSLP
jgi:nucleotidyltransferase AbiEii toxin of type IV toxin-antitoxin system